MKLLLPLFLVLLSTTSYAKDCSDDDEYWRVACCVAGQECDYSSDSTYTYGRTKDEAVANCNERGDGHAPVFSTDSKKRWDDLKGACKFGPKPKRK